MELDTVAKVRRAFFRLVGTTSDDDAFTDGGEAETEVVDLALTRGCRAAQRTMLKLGYGGWRQLSSALVWTMQADGSRTAPLPADFLRAYGDQRMSALAKTDGSRWGTEVTQRDDTARGNCYAVRDTSSIWLARNAELPTTLYLDYHYRHPVWDDELLDEDIDFPMEARPLIVAEAASVAMDEAWLLEHDGSAQVRRSIMNALLRAREEARDIARPTKQARQMRKSVRWGNRW